MPKLNARERAAIRVMPFHVMVCGGRTLERLPGAFTLGTLAALARHGLAEAARIAPFRDRWSLTDAGKAALLACAAGPSSYT